MKISLSPIPTELEFVHTPVDWRVEQENGLFIAAGAKTDWFFDPSGREKTDNAPAALFVTRDENFTLSARVQVEFASTFDAGVLQLRVSDDVWGKLCFEYSPQGQPMIVSVVTRSVSDDCNSVPIQGNIVYTRIARIGQTFAFHYSLDRNFWHFVRYFALGALDELRIGFSAQSPTGEGCTATFTQIAYDTRILKDLRNGE
jgi:uncharacterized protein